MADTGYHELKAFAPAMTVASMLSFALLVGSSVFSGQQTALAVSYLVRQEAGLRMSIKPQGDSPLLS
jgi:hypothetical protein